jgi:UDPglucose 6-dehydrogenase
MHTDFIHLKENNMKIGFIGLGKLGLPCALAIEDRGHQVVGYDSNPEVAKYILKREIPYKEEGANEFLQKSGLLHYAFEDVIDFADIIFVAVQTPHDSRYEGVTRLPKSRRDFNYKYLKEAIKDIALYLQKHKMSKVVAIISTVLPGTVDEQIKPIINKYDNFIKLVYNPFFIAMGTTIWDFLNPEFILLGVEDEVASSQLKKFYNETIGSKRVLSNAKVGYPEIFECSIRSAEAIKVLYNTYITQKIVWANAAMELCHYTGADVDDITDAMSLATDRIISTKYMYAGMGDGGGCHPRDNIALSWVSKKHGISYDWWEALMLAREKQTEFLVDIIVDYWSVNNHLEKIFIMGKAFKPETNLTVGSPSILLYNILCEKITKSDVIIVDPYTDNLHDKSALWEKKPSLFFIGTKHKVYAVTKFPEGSIIIDPWRYVPDQEGVTVIRIGEGK